MKQYIYVLQLNGGKYYVGKTVDVVKRFRQHLNGSGSAWTKKYKPIKIIKNILLTSPFDEDKYVKQYMSKYGIDNVRGGTYVTYTLEDNQLKYIKKEIWSAEDRCNRCGNTGHFIRECHAVVDIDGNKLTKTKKNNYPPTPPSTSTSTSISKDGSNSDSSDDSGNDSNNDSNNEDVGYTQFMNRIVSYFWQKKKNQ